ncbi:MAG TPA: recombinase family protein [Bryobacteraceae bacterium]|nr:recombinase family protein [Bryobacteraceae bacterium]
MATSSLVCAPVKVTAMKNGNGRRAPVLVEPKLSQAIRCAVYTRKSTDEGLQQDFNSLDAQREAGEAFVASQRGKGWQLVPERFDDGGFTGANMERPALRRLLAAVEARQVNCVVVYKVDRLSRSLLDFARMMELFDRYGASFASVTQNFNTTDSMGRLTLNILLSFAQFEREIISERTRDKMCAARRKGKWIGGHPVLGYNIDTAARRLVVNPQEAHQVRTIFDLYLDRGAMLPVLQDLESRGWRTKRWTTGSGQFRGGKPFTKSLLYGILTNAIYTGRVNHKGVLYPGEHEAIIERTTWERVQDILDRNGRTNGGGAKNKDGALLRGLLFCVPCGEPMCHTYSAKGVKRYRYYVCYRAQQRGWKNCKTKSVSAPAIESTVLEAVRRLGTDPQLAAEVVRQAREQLAQRREQRAKDVAVAEAALRQLNAETIEVAGDTARDPTARVDRLVDLQRQVQEAEHRLTQLATEGREIEADHIDEADALRALTEFNPVWEALTTREQVRLIQMLVARVGYDGQTGKVTVDFRSAGIKELCEGASTTKG